MNLVTGAAGHIGNVLTRELLNRGEKVRALVLPGEDLTGLAGLPVEVVEGNILDRASLEPALRQVQTVYHLAAIVSLLEEHEPIMRRVNVEGTRNMLAASAAAGVHRFVYTSSIHALTRPSQGIPIDETLPFDVHNPAGPYDRTKAEASLAVLESVRQGMDALIVCPTGVIGPFDYRRSEIGELILDWLHKPINFIVPGRFDFVDVRDVARGHILARQYGQPGQTYILGGEQLGVADFRSRVQRAAGIHTPAITLPGKLASFAAFFAERWYQLTRTRPKFTRYSIETLLSNSDIRSDRARCELGYTPRSLTQSIADTVSWWQENLSLTHAALRV